MVGGGGEGGGGHGARGVSVCVIGGRWGGSYGAGALSVTVVQEHLTSKKNRHHKFIKFIFPGTSRNFACIYFMLSTITLCWTEITTRKSK